MNVYQFFPYYKLFKIFNLKFSNHTLSLAETKIGFKYENLFFKFSIDSSDNKSILLKTYSLFCFAQIFFNIQSTISIFSSILGSEESTKCINKSDSILSSKVDEKALIKFGGKSFINQIVSFNNISFHNQSSV
jgi:hypothetical protein